jgi:hypothetical protein
VRPLPLTQKSSCLQDDICDGKIPIIQHETIDSPDADWNHYQGDLT